jgi:hypothetical protein
MEKKWTFPILRRHKMSVFAVHLMLMLVMLGVAGCLAGIPGNWVLMAGGILIALVGAGLIVYYLTFGIYYDGESFLYSSFGKKSMSYRYGQIHHQQLYVLQGGSVLVDLHMTDGSAAVYQVIFQSRAVCALPKAFAIASAVNGNAVCITVLCFD